MPQSSKKGSNLSGHHAIAGSERKPMPGARLLGPLEANEKMDVSIIVRRRTDGPAMPDGTYWQANPPGHRQFLSPEQFEKAYGAAPAEVDAVVRWADANGLSVREKKPGRRTVVVNGTAAQINNAFGVQLNKYEAPWPSRHKVMHRSGEAAPEQATQVHRGFEGVIHVPAELAASVIDVVGLDNRHRGGKNDGDPPNTHPLAVTEIAQLYQIPNTGAEGQVIGIFNGNGGGGNYDPTDITKCFENQPAGYQTAPTINNVDLTVDGTTYSNDPSGFLDLEISQDIQIASIVAQGATVNVYCTTDTEDGWLAYLNEIIMPTLGEPSPSVLTSSWYLGHDGSDAPSLLNALSAKFADLTTLGITVFNAQGDMGSNDGSGLAICQVQYPASDPSVTSCGGTTIGNVSGSTFEEWVWNDDTGETGGGVSDFFPVPAYQTEAGLAPVSKNDGKVRRGVPDVAGNASPNAGYTGIYMGGSGVIGNGTSAVAPLWAGLTAVMNQALGQPIGFLNPTIYALGESVFHDITSGDNNPNDGSGCPFYTAGPGWDACTGWGSPNGAELLGALQTLYQQNFYFLVDKSSFGVDELSNTLSYPNAFWLVLEGFSINQAAGILPAFAGPFDGFGGLTISMDPAGIEYEFPGNDFTPQRIRFPYDINWVSTSVNVFPAAGMSAEELLTATITVRGTTLTANALFEVLGGADPYFMNIGTPDNAFYLSQDLRVFTVTPETDGATPVGTVPFTFTSGSPTALDPTAAYNYVQAMIGYLNSNYNDPLGPDPFTSLLPDQTTAETGDSSVTPLTVNPHGSPFVNYNFGIARVRLNGSGSMAANTKVFFRLFNTQTFDTDYINTNAYVSAGDPNITFPSTGGADDPALPQPGTDGSGHINGCTIPFFAAADESDLAPGGVNNQNLDVSAGDGLWAYFGCYLDVYDPALMVGGHPVQYWLAGGTHHCLVAQIAYEGAPIQNAGGVIENPDNCDKLAQRNLQISPAGTTISAQARRVPQTFDMRPSPLTVQKPAGYLENYPDELMIDWGNIPSGSMVSIYWPQVNAADVVALAMKRYAYPFLTATDAHTIRCLSNKGVTYIPIPTGEVGGQSFAGLFTVDLSEALRSGNAYRITVRRITSRQVSAVVGRQPTTGAQPVAGQAQVGGVQPVNPVAGVVERGLNWRYIVGLFQVSIPVGTAAMLLPQEENLLAILKWRQTLLPASNKWYPVLTRYISYVAARVKGLGGDPQTIPASPNGYQGTLGVITTGNGHPEPVGAIEEITGKVRGLIFDRWGDFDGFSLETKKGELINFFGREKRMEEIVRQAWSERILLGIFVDPAQPRWPMSIVMLETTGV